jgi:hypothetical protein
MGRYMPMNILISFVLLFLSFSAFAEVSDKMASIPELWSHGFIVGLLIYFLTVWRIGFVFLGGLFVMFFAFAAYDTLNSPFIGEAIIKEQGIPYIFASYSATVIVTICSILGVIKNKRRIKRGI